MDGKLLSGIKSMYTDSLSCIRVKGGESEWFRIDSGVRQGCIMSPWLINVYTDVVMKKVTMRVGRRKTEIPGGGKRVDITLASSMQITWLCVVSWKMS